MSSDRTQPDADSAVFPRSERSTSAAASRETVSEKLVADAPRSTPAPQTRLMELAREQAFVKHAHFVLMQNTQGHVRGMGDKEWGFTTCPHPDCAIVQVAAPQSVDDALDIYVPGAWRCLKCNFALSKVSLFVQTGTVGNTREEVMNVTGEVCPNDGEPMIRETWHDRAEANYKWGVDLMEQIISATGAEHLPGAIEKIKTRFAAGSEGDVPAPLPARKAGNECDYIHRTCVEAWPQDPASWCDGCRAEHWHDPVAAVPPGAADARTPPDAPPRGQRGVPWLEGELFEAAMYAYRTAASFDPDDVKRAFEEVKAMIRHNMVAPAAPRDTTPPADDLRDIVGDMRHTIYGAREDLTGMVVVERVQEWADRLALLAGKEPT